ncbi:unnamed protein product [Darwinula stevensoni]|uniref:Uncharacterized protein n=1 Tax=Darwinula stevensoni TaxID=69355 RepID=A0A7R9AHR0_9CRUS|nr:unnamed protein product [Darwinula stevensoni]CAG0905049.1 unnamed protein product [Darwinula stevensoni]
MLLTPNQKISIAQRTLDAEILGLREVREQLASGLPAAVDVLLGCKGRVVVMGMGKSGHIGRKIAATLASTGAPALFVHPAEASHGDLGMVTSQDVVLAISNSGESTELTSILPVIKRLGVPLVAITGKPSSSLAQHADVVLNAAISREACPHNLAPTTSTTAQLALGDALAVVLLEARGFSAEDFARSHPGGTLGRKLLTHVADVMRQGEAVPRVSETAGLSAVMQEMSAKGLGAAAVVNATGEPVGIFTDGDLRRLVESGRDLRSLSAQAIMHKQPLTVRTDALAVDAVALMEAHSISSVLVVDAQGLMRMTDNLPIPRPAHSLVPYGALSVSKELSALAAQVRVVFFDVDGVLTDGSLYYSDQGEVLKAFHSLDGHGLKMLQRAGVVAAVISGRDSPALRCRLAHLGISQFTLGTEDKLPAAEQLLSALGLGWGQAAAMGDDWPDLPLLSHAAFACAPANAHHEVKAAAHYVTLAQGGQGAARELIDVVLQAQGQYLIQLEKHRKGHLSL